MRLAVLALVAARAAAFSLRVLHVNDHHSHIEASAYSFLTTIEEDIAYGGWALMVSAFAALAGDGENVLKVHAGDAITGTSYYSLFDGAPDAAVMNQVCFDAFAVGNHEFDDGDAALADFLDLLAGDGACGTAVLGANVAPGPDSPLEGRLASYVVKAYGDDAVGVIGVDLEAQGVNKIVVVSHVGYDFDVEHLATLRGVDVVVGGDSHSLLMPGAFDATWTLGTAGEYPTVVENGDGDPACVVQAWQYAGVVGDLPTDDAVLAALDAAYPSGFLRVAADAATAAAVGEYEAQIAASYGAVVATFDEAVCLDRFPGEGRSATCDLAATWTRGGGVCNLVATSFLALAREADVAVQNGGGCRVDIAAGDFTIEDGYEVLPFSNTIVTLDLTGAQLVDVLEEALAQPLDDGGSTGSYPYAAGLRFAVDASRPRGSRVSGVEVNARLAGAWAPVDADAVYAVATNDYIGGGKDGYHTFGEIESADTFLLYTQSFLDYLEDIDGPVPAPDEADFSTTSFTDAAGCLHTSANVGACAPAEDEPPAAEEADDGAGACFSAPGEALREACACDATCATCGYDATASDSVTGPDDCITCLAVGDCKREQRDVDLSSYVAPASDAADDAAADELPLLRFAVAGEVGVECVVFRDAESRINAREGAAVRDWLATDAAFHVMHDAPDADARFIASGCFGCRSTDDREPPLPDAPALVEFVDGGGDDDLAWLEICVRPACDAANTVHHSSRGAFLDDGPARPFPETGHRGRVGEAAGDAPWDAFL
ncbi:hypothetical protein JL722_3375 [Aureococcus anophagefferens]|nr:hypothetical protein JL722_3375 [Aureococcus anophagefferens]